MQIKTTGRYHINPHGMVEVKRMNSNKHWGTYQENIILIYCFWECKLGHYGKQDGEYSKNQTRRIIWSSNSPAGYKPNGQVASMPKSSLHSHFPCSTTHTNQDIEATRASRKGRIKDKGNVGQAHGGLIQSHKQEWIRSRSTLEGYYVNTQKEK